MVGEPLHTVALAEGVTAGNGVTLTFDVTVFVHPVAVIVPVTVYAVLPVGLVTVTDAPVVVFKPAEGLQL